MTYCAPGRKAESALPPEESRQTRFIVKQIYKVNVGDFQDLIETTFKNAKTNAGRTAIISALQRKVQENKWDAESAKVLAAQLLSTTPPSATDGFYRRKPISHLKHYLRF
jgi:hypothetical protein